MLTLALNSDTPLASVGDEIKLHSHRLKLGLVAGSIAIRLVDDDQ
jgi:hypothetical protein